jgi:hypothetical protein
MSDAAFAEGSPYQSPVEPGKQFIDSQLDPRSLFEPLYQRRIWPRILGIILILLGVLYSLLIIGAVIGVPLAFAGYYLFQSASLIEQGFQGHVGALREASNKLSLSLMIAGIMILVWAAFMVLYFLFVFFVLGVSIFAQ